MKNYKSISLLSLTLVAGLISCKKEEPKISEPEKEWKLRIVSQIPEGTIIKYYAYDAKHTTIYDTLLSGERLIIDYSADNFVDIGFVPYDFEFLRLSGGLDGTDTLWHKLDNQYAFYDVNNYIEIDQLKHYTSYKSSQNPIIK